MGAGTAAGADGRGDPQAGRICLAFAIVIVKINNVVGLENKTRLVTSLYLLEARVRARARDDNKLI